MKPDDVKQGLRNIGERIAWAGREAGVTRREMGELAGVDELTVRSWEETRSRPTLSQVKELAARCGTTPDWLLGRDLIEGLMPEQARHGYVRQGGIPQEGLPLVDLEVTRQFILWVWQQPHRESNQAGDLVVTGEIPDDREAGAAPRLSPDAIVE